MVHVELSHGSFEGSSNKVYELGFCDFESSALLKEVSPN